MNDLVTLRGPRLAPPADALERALATGRTRLRRRRATTMAAATTACLALVVAVTFSGSDSRSLDSVEQADQPTASPAVPAPRPGATGVPRGGPAVLPARGGGPDASTAAPRRDPSIAATPPLTTVPLPVPSPGRRWIGRGSRAVLAQRKVGNEACVPVNFAARAAQTGYCAFLEGPAEIEPGTLYLFELNLCRSPSHAQGTLTFVTREEAKITASRGGRTQWSVGDPGTPDEHTVTLMPGDCRVWRFEWQGQDNDGYALPPGTYRVQTGAVATEPTTGEALFPAPTFMDVAIRD